MAITVLYRYLSDLCNLGKRSTDALFRTPGDTSSGFQRQHIHTLLLFFAYEGGQLTGKSIIEL